LHHIAKLLRAGALLGAQRTCVVKRTMVGTSVAVVLSGAPVVMPVAHAVADQISTTKNQVTALEAKAEAGAAQVHRFTLAYEQANLAVSNLSQQVSADQQQVSQLQGQVSQSESSLRRQALMSYTGASSAYVNVTNPTTDPSVRAEYLQVATGDINDTVDQYRTHERQLSTAQANLVRQERSGQAAAQTELTARQRVLAEATEDQAQLDELQVQLSQDIEAAAVAARQQAASAQAAAARPPDPATMTQGLPVNNGLVAVVHTLVAAPAPAPTPPPVKAPHPTAPPHPAAPPPPAPRTTVPPPRPLPPPPPPSHGYSPASGVWLQLRECESGDNYRENTGNGYYGAYQFSQQTWSGLGLASRPDLASPQTQDAAAIRLQAEVGWGAWPACSVAIGLR
jgi:peptidoglycan hydrolase CwlO-like protein